MLGYSNNLITILIVTKLSFITATNPLMVGRMPGTMVGGAGSKWIISRKPIKSNLFSQRL